MPRGTEASKALLENPEEWRFLLTTSRAINGAASAKANLHPTEQIEGGARGRACLARCTEHPVASPGPLLGFPMRLIELIGPALSVITGSPLSRPNAASP